MKTITELLKERMTIRTTDPARSNIIMMIVDGAKKIAKEAGREPQGEDIIASVKSQIKQTEKALNQIKENGGDPADWDRDLGILKSFLPAALTEAQTLQIIEDLLAQLPEAERNKKSQGKIMAQLKAVENLDLSLASRLLGSRLA